MPDSFRDQSLTIGKIPGTNIGIGVGSGLARRSMAATLNGNPLGVGTALLPPIIAGAAATALLPHSQDKIHAKTNGRISAATQGLISGNSLNNGTNKPNGYNSNPQNTGINNKAQHNSTMIAPPAPDVKHLPQSADDLKVGQDGSMNLLDPYKSKLAVGGTDYVNQKATLNNQLTAASNQYAADYGNSKAQLADGAKITGIKNQLDTLETQNQLSGTIQDPYDGAKKTVAASKQAISDLSKSGSNLLESNGTINDTVFKTDKNYSGLVSFIDNLQKQNPDMVIYTPGMSSDVLKSNILQAERTMVYNTYYNKLGGSYTGGGSTTSFTNPPVPTTILPAITNGTVGPNGPMDAAQTQAANPAYVSPALQ